MSTSTSPVLERKAVLVRAVDQDSLGLRESLAAEAEDVLGYTKLKADIAQSKQTSALTQTLHRLGIMPFSPESVAAYKKQIAFGNSPSFAIRHPQITEFIIGLSLLVFVLSFGNSFTGWFISVYVGLAAIALMVLGLSVMLIMIEKTDDGTGGEWKLVPLKGYERAVPEFAIQRAVQLKKELPTAEIFIDEYIAKKVDPFLVVKHGEEQFYIDVWDEPKFEAQL